MIARPVEVDGIIVKVIVISSDQTKTFFLVSSDNNKIKYSVENEKNEKTHCIANTQQQVYK
jgi:hypothetical protein